MPCSELKQAAVAAALSEDAYKYESDLPDWVKKEGWVARNDYPLGKYSPTGYFGRAYVNDASKQVFIAHQGTELDAGEAIDGASGLLDPANPADYLENQTLKDLGVTDTAIALTGVNPQTAESMLFTNSTLKSLAAEGKGGYEVTHTGHSLGGGLAGLNSVFYEQKAVTIDSYGYDNQLKLWKKLNIISEDEYKNGASKVINYGSSGGTVKELFDLGPGRYGPQVEIDDIKVHSKEAYSAYLYSKYQDCMGMKKGRGRQAANFGAYHTCPLSDGDTPHTGGPISSASPNVFINKKPAARFGDGCQCKGINNYDMVTKGSVKVFINKKPAARVGDPTAHGGVITGPGSANVLIGG